jgi:hypothetical protein
VVKFPRQDGDVTNFYAVVKRGERLLIFTTRLEALEIARVLNVAWQVIT